MHFFEKNHGQSDGDSIHSVIETAVERGETITMPSELMGTIRSSAKKSLILSQSWTQKTL